MWNIQLPTSVPVTKTKKFFLNLNHYRNAHHFILSKAKIEFHDIVLPLLSGLPKLDAVNLTYTLFTGTKREADTANVCCIVDKFFSDTLVSAGKIDDDNYKIVKDVNFRFGGLDKNNPHVIVTIEPVPLLI